MFKPMLAAEADLDKLTFPLLASPKLDGIRAVVRDGTVFSRSNKPIPNKYVQSLFANYEHFDGELIVGQPTAHDVYRQTTSHVMSHDKEDFHVNFFAFDSVRNPSARYIDRRQWLVDSGENNCGIVIHEQREIVDLSGLLSYEDILLDEGYEGLILRQPHSPYKMGRSTVKEGYLLKLKRFTDAEFEVIGFEERMKNNNEKVTNELGRSARSSHAAGKAGRGDLGALICKGDGFTFNVGTGFSDSERAEIWSNQTAYEGRLAKVKFFAIGMKDAPRHPVFLGWRDRSDT